MCEGQLDSTGQWCRLCRGNICFHGGRTSCYGHHHHHHHHRHHQEGLHRGGRTLMNMDNGISVIYPMEEHYFVLHPTAPPPPPPFSAAAFMSEHNDTSSSSTNSYYRRDHLRRQLIDAFSSTTSAMPHSFFDPVLPTQFDPVIDDYVPDTAHFASFLESIDHIHDDHHDNIFASMLLGNLFHASTPISNASLPDDQHIEIHGSQPASKSAIEAMPVFKFTSRSVDRDAESGTQNCAVCTEAFMAGDEVREMPCKHLYHSSCILPWLALHNSCPVCRHQVPAAEESLEDQNTHVERQNEEQRISVRQNQSRTNIVDNQRNDNHHGYSSITRNAERPTEENANDAATRDFTTSSQGQRISGRNVWWQRYCRIWDHYNYMVERNDRTRNRMPCISNLMSKMGRILGNTGQNMHRRDAGNMQHRHKIRIRITIRCTSTNRNRASSSSSSSNAATYNKFRAFRKKQGLTCNNRNAGSSSTSTDSTNRSRSRCITRLWH